MNHKNKGDMKSRLLIAAAAFAIVGSANASTLTTDDVDAIYTLYTSEGAPSRVSVHDPSVVIGYQKTDGTVTGEATDGATEIYCIFGSHLAWAKSADLQNWTLFTNNITTNYATIFADDATYSAHGSSSYDVSGNMWAPDVIWNKAMQKWCMYMSINGDNWYSSVVLLTADDLLGSWTRVGTVVYSFGSASTYWSETDGATVTGESTKPDRYALNRNGNLTYGLNAIDPCVFYDADGYMWMTYGSWFGGLYMIRLDEETGLRDATYTYETTDGTAAGALSDVYQGIKVAGGNNMSGEASYVQYIDGRYYLFVTYGGLTTTGGYNMRVFSSEDVTGPYLDLSGQDARYCSSVTASDLSRVGQIKYTVGTKLMSYYKWDFQTYAQIAQGHNSAIVDDDGKIFVVYHTRFNTGNEGHEVRVRQMFKASNNGLVATPFEYRGETLSTTAYATSEVVGTYRILYHVYTDPSSLAYNSVGEIVLNEDGTVTGTYTGTWSQDESSPAVSLTLSVSGNTYIFNGYFIEQKMEETGYETMCFTTVNKSSDCPLWGYKVDEDLIVALDAKELATSTTVLGGSTFYMPTTGTYGSTYTWESSNTSIIDNEGNAAEVDSDTQVDFTLTVSYGSSSYTTTVPVTVTASLPYLPISNSSILGVYSSGEAFNEAAPTFAVDETTGASISFQISNYTSDWTVVAHSTDDYYTMFLSVLRVTGSDHYEALATLSDAAKSAGFTSSSAWTIFFNSSYYVTVSYNVDGTISYYRDGELMLTFEASTSPSWSSSTSTARTPSQIAASVIDYIAAGKIVFDLTGVENVCVGYAVDYTGTPVSHITVDESNIGIRSRGNTIVVTGKDDADRVEVFTLSGALVYSGTESEVTIANSGLYAVRVAGSTSALVCVK